MKTKGWQKEAVSCFERAIELDPEMEWAYYSLACYYALQGKKKDALKLFRISLEKGLRDKDHINSDSDLDSLRDGPEFKKLMKQYFDEKWVPGNEGRI